jgi:hypothetical protein
MPPGLVEPAPVLGIVDGAPAPMLWLAAAAFPAPAAPPAPPVFPVWAIAALDINTAVNPIANGSFFIVVSLVAEKTVGSHRCSGWRLHAVVIEDRSSDCR